MYKFSFIDFGWKNFLTDSQGDVIVINCDSYYEAEEWLLEHGEKHGWTNQGVKYFCWDVEEGEVSIDDIP